MYYLLMTGAQTPFMSSFQTCNWKFETNCSNFFDFFTEYCFYFILWCCSCKEFDFYVTKKCQKNKDCFVTESSGSPAKVFQIVFTWLFSLCVKEYAHARIFKNSHFFYLFFDKNMKFLMWPSQKIGWIFVNFGADSW